jgi:alkylhydroperoxidase family enzyme
MENRVNLGKEAPELYQAVAALAKLVDEQAAKAGLAEGFTPLLRLRASQINGCAFCLRLRRA